MKKYFVYLMAVAVMIITGCKENEEKMASAPELVPVTGISLSESSFEIEAGSKKIITVTLAPSGASKWYVSWITSDPAVAAVDVGRDFCELTAKKAGIATLTATTADGGHTATCTVKVLAKALNPVTDITLTAKTALDLSKLETGRKFFMLATVTPANADNKTVIWKSSKESVATISTDGIVECIGTGTTTITVESDENSAIKKSLDITVSNSDVFIVADFETDEVKKSYPVYYSNSERTGICEVVDEPLDMEEKTPPAAVVIPTGEGKALKVHGTFVNAEYGLVGQHMGPELVVTLPVGSKLGDYKFLYLDLYFHTGAGNGGRKESDNPNTNWNAGAGWSGWGAPQLAIIMDSENKKTTEAFAGNPRHLGSLTFPENNPFNANYWSAYTWARGIELDLSKLELDSDYKNLNSFKIGLSIRSGALSCYMDNFYLKK